MKKIVILILCITFCFLNSTYPLQAAALGESASIEFVDNLNSQSAKLINLNTDTVVYEKAPELEVEPVFLTKIMIALLTLESLSPNVKPSPCISPSSEVSLSQQKAIDEAIEAEKTRRKQELEAVNITAPDYIFDELREMGSSAPNIRKGETLNAYQLLNMLMITSGNDAAMILADYIGNGSIPDCVDMMNAKAKQLGCTNTFFTNVHGFHDPQQITTVNDICKVISPLLNDKVFMSIVELPSYTLEPTNQSERHRTYRTTNLMLDNTDSGRGYYYRPIKGIKTGRTDSSGFCFLGYTSWNSMQYLCVTMGAPIYKENGNMKSNGAFEDTHALCSWAYNNLEIKTIVERGQPVVEIPLNYAWDSDKIPLVTDEDFSAILPKNVDMKSVLLLPDENIPKELEAPVEEGVQVGRAKVVYANKELGSVSVITGSSAERNTIQVVSDVLDSILTSVWTIVVIVILVLILLTYGISFILKNRRNRNKVNRSRNNNYRRMR